MQKSFKEKALEFMVFMGLEEVKPEESVCLEKDRAGLEGRGKREKRKDTEPSKRT